MKYLDLLLFEDAVDWIKSNPEVIHLIVFPDSTQSIVAQFTSLRKERFPSKNIEITPISMEIKLSDLRQQLDESLISYYTRTVNLMQKYGAKDTSSTLGTVLHFSPMAQKQKTPPLSPWTRTRSFLSASRQLRPMFKIRFLLPPVAQTSTSLSGKPIAFV